MTGDDMAAAGGDGTQAIRRAAAILRHIGQGAGQGVNLASISEALGLSRSTSYRILKCLVDEGFVEHNAAARRYSIGRLTYELGLTVTNDALDIARWRAAVDRVALRAGVTCYLMSRSGIEATCLLKTDGTAVIRVIPVEVGQRRLLGVGAGSTALLAALDPDTAERVVQAIEPGIRSYPNLTVDVVRRLVAETRRTGFTVSAGNVAKDVLGVGMAIPKPGGVPSLALSIAALAQVAGPEQIAAWKQIMRQEVEAVLKR